MPNNDSHINPDDYLLLLLDGQIFEGMMQRHQQLMTRLAKKVRVFYQEESASIVSYIFRRRFPFFRAFAYMKGVREIAPNIWHIHCPPGLPERFGLKNVNYYNHYRAYKQMIPHLKRFGGKLIVWVAHPKSAEVVDHIDRVLTIYDCFDSFGDFVEESWKAEETRRLELELLKKSDLVLASAKSLVETRGNHNSNTYLIPNGADTNHFQKKMDKPLRNYSPDISKIKRPIVGYMGDIASWFDIKSLELCARSMPDVSFAFLGTVKVDVEKLRSLDNVHFFGRIDYDDLPYFIAFFDVCTIPFVLNEMTMHVNPIKVYEYMATGLPIVSSKLPELVQHGDLIYYYDTNESFLESVKTALDEKKNNTDKPERRIATARANSWDARADRIWELIQDALLKKS